MAIFHASQIDGKESVTFFTPEAVWAWLKTLRGRHIFYFHNLDYDIGAFYRNPDLMKAKRIHAGSRLLSVEVYRHRHRVGGGKKRTTIVEFRDSAALLKCSLAELGESLGYPKLTTPEKFYQTEPQPITPEDIAYCERDVAVLARGIRELRGFISEHIGRAVDEIPLTIASVAYRLWSECYWPWKHGAMPVNGAANDLAAKAYYGGRVEVGGAPLAEEIDAVEYDVVSEYPSVMRGNNYPDPKSTIYAKEPSIEYLMKYLNNPDKVIIADLDLEEPAGDESVRFLPRRSEEVSLTYHEGEFAGALCEPEIRLALSYGWEIKAVREIAIFNVIRPFDEYVNSLYEYRAELKARKDPRQYMVKIALNSLYGKFGQKDVGETISDPAEIEEIENINRAHGLPIHDGFNVSHYGIHGYVLESKNAKPCRNQFFPFAAFVTSYARCLLQKAIKANYEAWLYSDTDSMYLKAGYEPNIEIGSDLGQWEKGGAYALTVHGKKIYEFGDKRRWKGVPSRAVSEGFNPREGVEFETPLKLKRALRSKTGENVGTWIQTSKAHKVEPSTIARRAPNGKVDNMKLDGKLK